ncbi:hypothetical protein PGB90_005064 [Kerria lacca]
MVFILNNNGEKEIFYNELMIVSIIYKPSNVRGCKVTQPVCTYSINCRKTSGSNSSINIVRC